MSNRIPLANLLRQELSSLKAYAVPAKPSAVKLDANESPWPLPDEARDKLVKMLSTLSLHRYPDGRASAAREALADRYGGHPDGYLLGNGSDELIALIATALSKEQPGRPRPAVVYPTPTFVMYGMTSRAHGWETVEVPLDSEWQLDLGAMQAAITKAQANVIYYASPNNPTGNTFEEDSLEALIKAFPNTLHVIDEAYGAFSDQALSHWCERFPNLGVMGTLSKIGLAGIRFGWLRMNPALCVEVDKVRQPFSINSLTQRIAELALTELAPILRGQVQRIVKERARLRDALQSLKPLHVFPSSANFLLVRVSEDAETLSRQLLDQDIAVRTFRHETRLANHLRITVGTPEQNDRLLAALQTALK